MVEVRTLSNNHRCFRARETYFPLNATPKILCLNINDLLTFIKESDNATGCFVQNTRTKKKGFVSKELLRTLTGESDDHPWYFGALNREGAERYLVLDYNVQGSFLVRESVRYPGSFVVSLKDYDHAEEKFKIRHIKISCARGTYRYNHKSYQTLSSLVDKASKDKIFSSPLTNPCLILRSHHPEMVGDSDTCDTTEDEIEFGSAISLAPPTGILVSGKWRGLINVCVKTVQSRSHLKLDPTSHTSLCNEYNTMRGLNHPNIVQAFALAEGYQDGALVRAHLVMEALGQGGQQQLIQFLRTDAIGKFELDELLLLAREILRGLTYIHSKELIHCDLGAHSVFIDERFRAKIGNFAFARPEIESKEFELRDHCFSKRTAIETLETRLFTYHSDIWSYGVFLWEMITFGDEPFRGMSTSSMVRELRGGKCSEFSLPLSYPGVDNVSYLKLCEIIRQCLQLNFKSRPSLTTIRLTLQTIVDYS